MKTIVYTHYFLFLFFSECECFDHATTCTYSAFLNQGICNDCIHNTRGIRCDQCVERFYRNITVPLNHQDACMRKCWELKLKICLNTSINLNFTLHISLILFISFYYIYYNCFSHLSLRLLQSWNNGWWEMFTKFDI